jgi:branched-chain amino acid transport system permease protein
MISPAGAKSIMSIFSQIIQFTFSGLANGGTYILVALGLNIIYNSTGIINFAQGEFAVFGAFIMITLCMAWNIPMVVAFPLAVVALAGLGALFERSAIHPLKKPSVITMIIITLGGSIFLRGAAMLIWGKYPQRLAPFIDAPPIKLMGAIIKWDTLLVLLIVALVVAALYWFFEKTVTGKAMRACAENREAALLMGINVDRIVLLSFALSAALGAVAGIVYTPGASMEYGRGPYFALRGFEVAIIGGLGNSVGAVLAGILLGLFETFSAGFLSPTYKEAITLGLLLLVLFVKPSGILGKAEVTRLKDF